MADYPYRWAEAVICPDCRSAVGEMCQTPSGRLASQPHVGRRALARAKGHAPQGDLAVADDLTCPICGAQGWQEYVDVTFASGAAPRKIPGYKRCPNDDREDHRPHLHFDLRKRTGWA